jgi:hypothetical protein
MSNRVLIAGSNRICGGSSLEVASPDMTSPEVASPEPETGNEREIISRGFLSVFPAFFSELL